MSKLLAQGKHRGIYLDGVPQSINIDYTSETSIPVITICYEAKPGRTIEHLHINESWADIAHDGPKHKEIGDSVIDTLPAIQHTNQTGAVWVELDLFANLHQSPEYCWGVQEWPNGSHLASRAIADAYRGYPKIINLLGEEIPMANYAGYRALGLTGKMDHTLCVCRDGNKLVLCKIYAATKIKGWANPLSRELQY